MLASLLLHICLIWGCIQKFPDWVDDEIYAYKNKHSLRCNTKGYGGSTYYTDSQNSDTTAPSGKELYHLQLSLQAVSTETFGYTLVGSAVNRSDLWLVTWLNYQEDSSLPSLNGAQSKICSLLWVHSMWLLLLSRDEFIFEFWLNLMLQSLTV
jgi:hypothetical protein